MNIKNFTTVLLIVILPFWLNAQPYEQEAIILASDGQNDDMFGNSLSISGNIAVIGTPQDDDAAYNAGAAYIYKRTGDVWNFIQKITADDGEVADMFGLSVDIDGDYIVVGAYQAVGITGNTGAAYIFKKNGTTWEQQAKIFADDGESADNFGKSIAISGDYVVVGADNKDFGTGAAYIFNREDITWTQVAKLIEDDGDMMDYFAHSVDIDGDYIVAGAWQNNAPGSNTGAAYVFFNNSGTWEFYDKLTANDATIDDGLGYSVAISGDYIVAGAHGDDGSTGSAYVFYNNAGTWEQQAKLTASDAHSEDFFGKSVSISGDYVIISSQRHDEAKAEEGAAYLYVRDETNWTQQEQFIASNANDTGLFGYCVTIDNDYAMVSTVQDNGAVYVFGPEGVNINDFIKNEIIVSQSLTTNIITITNAQNSNLQIIDISGRTVKDFSINNQQFHLDLSSYNSGIYFLKIRTENYIFTEKIIVK